MKKYLRFSAAFFGKPVIFIVFLTFLAGNHTVFGQCPVANNCTPGSAPASAFPFGMGIYNVTIGSGATGFTNATTSGASAGYQDFSCTKKATVLEGAATTISVATNPNSDENVRVWVDLNNNGTFEAATELVFSSNNARNHAGSFAIPVAAAVVKNQVLRLRVSSDDNGSPIPGPCTTPAFGQVEDYGITVLPNTSKPIPDFTVNNPVTCSPTVQFTNLTQNGATSYTWNFGDNTTSSAASPSHTYTTPGTYTISLIACNANGCDTLTKVNYVAYHTNVPVAASCTPTTTSYCCGYGINDFSFHTLNNSSQVGNAGYEDFTCGKLVYVMEDNTYPVSVSSIASNPQDVWIYIDYNNDGIFAANELAFSKLGTINPSGFITIKSGVVKKRPLRMRVIADSQGTPAGTCANRTNGQVEDYSIIIQQNANKPLVDFSSDFITLCDTLVQFTDKSQNAPVSWLWDFGDGNMSTQQNPQHLYTATGAYTVSLISCNANGCDTLTKKQNIYIRKPCPQYCVPLYNNSGNAVMYVNFNTIKNSTGIDTSGYGDYTHLSTNLVKGNTYTFSSTTNVYNARLHVWIDYNQDGDFDDPGELVVSVGSAINIVRNIQIPVSARSGPTRMRVAAQPSWQMPGTACIVNSSSEVEDYTLNIQPNNQPPTALFSSGNQLSCGNRVSFADTSANSPLTWYWNFGDPASGAANFSTEENPTHIYNRIGMYTVSLKVCNDYGCDSIVKTNYISIFGTQGLRPINCKPGTTNRHPNEKQGIYNVTFNTINSSSPAGNGYEDHSCNHQTTVEQGGAYPISINTGNFNKSGVLVWIDFNDDAVFDPVTELVYSSSNKFIHTDTLVIPTTAVLNTPVRMRVMSDSYLPNVGPGPCVAVRYGQVEDYAITIVANTGKPVAAFSPSSFSSCDPLVSFTDRSTGSPTSWSWDFGDFASGAANTSNQKNPTHTFSSWGNFAVTLTVCNAAGCHTYRQVVTIMGLPNAKQSCATVSLPNAFGEGIYNVKFLNVDHSSANSSEGHKDFSCWGNALTPPGSFLLTVQTNPNRSESVRAYIDFNDDGGFSGPFEQVELDGPIGMKTGIVVVPTNAVKWRWLLFRIVDRDGNNPSAVGPCFNGVHGQAEDYAIKVVDRIDLITDIMAVKKPKNDFANQLKLYPNPSNGTFSLEIPSVFSGNYQLEVQNLVGQKVAERALKASEIAIPVDLSNLPKGVYFIKVFNPKAVAIRKIIIE